MAKIVVPNLQSQKNEPIDLVETCSLRGGQNNGREPIVNRELYDFLNFRSGSIPKLDQRASDGG